MRCKACGFDEKKARPFEGSFFKFLKEAPANQKEELDEDGYGIESNTTMLALYACPKCGTIRAKHYLIPD